MKKQKPLYLITGGTGFLGQHLIPLLIQSGAKVRILARNLNEKNQIKSNNNSSIEYVPGSILEESVVLNAAKGCSGIFHLAAVVIHSRLPEHAEVVRKSVLTGTLNVMTAAKKNKCRVVYASSSGTIGCSWTPLVTKDDSPYATKIVKDWPYYIAKIEAEIRAIKYAKENGIELIVMRPSMMFGPGDDRYRSTHVILSFLNQKIPLKLKGGISFVDVRDVAKVFKTAMEKGKAGETYLLGSSNMSLEEFFQTLEKISHIPGPKIRIPFLLSYSLIMGIDLANRKIRRKWESGFDPVRAEMARHYWFISSDKAKKELDFNPIDPIQTLKDTIDWIQQNQQQQQLLSSLSSSSSPSSPSSSSSKKTTATTVAKL